MFAALPILSIPMFKQKIAHALDSSDVPMGESATLTEGDPELLGRRRRLRGRHLAPVGVGLVVVIFGVGALAEDVDAPTRVLSASATTTTKPSGPTTTTVAVLVPTDDPNASTTSTTRGGAGAFPVPGESGAGPQLVPGPAAPPATQAPAPPSVSINGPRGVPESSPVDITWSSSGADSVSVTGPTGLSSSQHSGTHRYCATNMPTACRNRPGTYTYTITATNAGGTRSASVTVSVF
jgi:hypothetical protein